MATTKYIVDNAPDQTINGNLNITGTTNIKPYKVYTALLTQSGGDNIEGITGTPLTIGRTYRITAGGPPAGNWDFTNVGAPNNDFDTYFVATGTTPNSWGVNITLGYNTGAPVVTVLENTIGNIWWTFNDVGSYSVNSNVLFTSNKTTLNINLMGDDLSAEGVCLGAINTNSELTITTGNATTQSDNVLYWSTPIEIRVYN